jgi:hypothetical protein
MPSGPSLLLCGDAAARGIEPLAAALLRLCGGNALQRFLDAERHCGANDLSQLRRFDRLGTALDQQLAELAGSLLPKPRFFAVE